MITIGDGSLFLNPRYGSHSTDASLARDRFGVAGRAHMLAALEGCPRHRPTILHALEPTARQYGVAAIGYKDEGKRLGMQSFKALGGAYAVAGVLTRAILTRTGTKARIADLVEGGFGDITRAITVACATDGNHGRSVAAGARLFGCRARIYLHEHVPEPREAAIAAYGAEIIRVPGTYDDSVRRARIESEERGAIVVADTSPALDDPVTLDVMQGYSVMVGEALDQFPAPTHVFAQGGVGGMAAALAAMLDDRFEAKGPRLVVVEPLNADCLQASARAGRAVVSGSLDTTMEMLACGEPSAVAWAILNESAFAFATVPDWEAARAIDALAATTPSTPSAAAGYAGFVACAANGDARSALGLDGQSRVLLFGTEGPG